MRLQSGRPARSTENIRRVFRLQKLAGRVILDADTK